jgi:hypothetical protein
MRRKPQPLAPMTATRFRQLEHEIADEGDNRFVPFKVGAAEAPKPDLAKYFEPFFYGYDGPRQFDAENEMWIRFPDAEAFAQERARPFVEARPTGAAESRPSAEEVAESLRHEIYQVWVNSKKAFGTAGMQALIKGQN